jgi:acyl carrier protein
MDEIGNIKEQIREYIISEFLPGESPSNLKDETPLRTSGVLDSMATLRLVCFVEQHFGIEVDAYEAGVENFEDIGAMASFIREKQARRTVQ